MTSPSSQRSSTCHAEVRIQVGFVHAFDTMSSLFTRDASRLKLSISLPRKQVCPVYDLLIHELRVCTQSTTQPMMSDIGLCLLPANIMLFGAQNTPLPAN